MKIKAIIELELIGEKNYTPKELLKLVRERLEYNPWDDDEGTIITVLKLEEVPKEK